MIHPEYITSESDLSKHSLQVDGIWLEMVLPYFRILSVSGITPLSPDYESQDYVSDGAYLTKYRYPTREITVGFALEIDDYYQSTAAIEKLIALIPHDGSTLRLIFNDDPTTYFQGIYTGVETSAPSWDGSHYCIIGTIAFFCADPFKYAVETKSYTATLVDDVLTAEVVNDGNMPASIDYEITMNSDNGYIGITSDQGAMEYGSVEEVDGTTYTQNEQLATLTDLAGAADDHGSEAWHRADRYGTAGTLAMGKTGGKSGFLVLNSIGDDTKVWNGGMKTLTLPADSEGVTGCKSFYCYFHIFLHSSKWNETGHMTLSFLTADDKPICGMTWYKNNPQNNNGNYEFWVYDSTSAGNPPYSNAYTKILKSMHYICDHNQSSNPWYWNWGHCDIKKVGSKITYYYYSKYYTYDLSELANMECAKVQFSIMAAKGRSGDLMLNALGMDIFRFQKLNVEKFNDTPNRYSNGDVLRISGDEGKVYVNDMPKMGDEVTGTTYFKANPGTNTVEIRNSSWAKDVTAKVSIRERWL